MRAYRNYKAPLGCDGQVEEDSPHTRPICFGAHSTVGTSEVLRSSLLTLGWWCLVAKLYSFVTPWTIAHQASVSMGFPRQEYWSGLPFPSSGHFPNPGIEPMSPELQGDSLPLSHQGSPSVGVCKERKRRPPHYVLLQWREREHPLFSTAGVEATWKKLGSNELVKDFHGFQPFRSRLLPEQTSSPHP